MSKTPILSIAVVAIIVALAFALNPSPEQHRAKIKAAVAERGAFSLHAQGTASQA